MSPVLVESLPARRVLEWPIVGGQELEGVLQIRSKDLPYRPAPLENIALIQLFCLCRKEQDDFPVIPMFETDEWYHVRTCSTLRGLRTLERRTEPLITPCTIEWSRVENEIPSYPDNLEWLDDEKQDDFRKLEDWSQLQDASYSSHTGTKAGGWPTFCQNGLNRNGYAIQIGSEELANFMWGDNGVAVLFRPRDKWTLYWDCY